MKNKDKKRERPGLARRLKRLFTSKQDPAGSYTGTPCDGSDFIEPEQDADDL
ncbi:MAG: hypothetical protein LBH24_03925 [Clostridiales bacterium]|jgi:hypothetical protein|nr:hypothetical protein [Clostridiales bacterium]